ncbi:MAG: hypothetical protein ACPGFB_04225 [Verrucomicrobiales bacterium]
MKSDHTHLELIARYLDGQASPEETAQLEALMLEYPQLRADFLAYARLDASLPQATGANTPQNPIKDTETSVVPFPSKKRWLPAPLAALLMVGAIVISSIWFSDHRSNQNPNNLIIAEFGELENCQWVDTSTVIQPGDAIRTGQLIELSSGTAKLLFHTGAELTLVGPATIELSSHNRGFLSLGEAYLVAETPESKGFTIETPVSKFVDISTAFTATVSPDGLSRLEVSDGEVDVLLDGIAPKRLKRGETIYVEPGERRILTRIESGDGTPLFRFPTIEPPSQRDYADQSLGHAKISAVRGELRGGNARSGPVSVLLDGSGQSHQDSPLESAFFETGTHGQFIVDLGQVVPVSKIQSYSWHQHNEIEEHRERARQEFTLYGYSGSERPDLSLPMEESGWTRIASVNSDEFFRVTDRLDRPVQQACSITSATGNIGHYRYLLWDLKGNTFYGEIDVFVEQR